MPPAADRHRAMTDDVGRQDRLRGTSIPRARPPGWQRNALVVGLASLLGIALLTLGVPRTIASWEVLAAEAALGKIGAGQSPSDKELADGVVGLERGLAWLPSGRWLSDLGWLEVQQAIRLPDDDPHRQELLNKAEQHLTAGLRIRPADGVAWLRLAFARETGGAPGRQVALALLQSMDVSPFDRGLWIYRGAKLLVYWPVMTLDELLAVRSNLHAMWIADTKGRLGFLKTVQAVGRMPLIDWVLGDDPEAQAQFEALKPDLDPAKTGTGK